MTDPTDRNEYERGVIDALVEIGWKRGPDVLFDLHSEVTGVENWNELVEAAIDQWESEMDETVENMGE
jgi:hypothetical protein